MGIGGAPTDGSARASPISLTNIYPQAMYIYGKTLGNSTIVPALTTGNYRARAGLDGAR
jgi:hypothetical protein